MVERVLSLKVSFDSARNGEWKHKGCEKGIFVLRAFLGDLSDFLQKYVSPYCIYHFFFVPLHGILVDLNACVFNKYVIITNGRKPIISVCIRHSFSFRKV